MFPDGKAEKETLALEDMNKDILVLKANSPMEKAKKLVELQAKVKEYKEIIDELKVDLLKTTQELGVLTLKTECYTISRARKVTPKVEDFDELKKSLDKANIPYETKEVFHERMNLVFKMAVDEGRNLKGLEALETEYIMVRVRDPKKEGGEKDGR